MLRRAWALIDRTGWLVAIVCVAVIGGLVLQQAVSQTTLRESQLRACHRLNVLRAYDNRKSLRDYRLFGFVQQLTAANLKLTAKRMGPAEREQSRLFLLRLEDEIAAEEWTPLSACYPATDHPATYRAPEPVPFAHATPPPTALTIGPGE